MIYEYQLFNIFLVLKLDFEFVRDGETNFRIKNLVDYRQDSSSS